MVLIDTYVRTQTLSILALSEIDILQNPSSVGQTQAVDGLLRGKVVYGMKPELKLQEWLNHQSKKMVMRKSLVDRPLPNAWQSLEVSNLAWLLLLEYHPSAKRQNPKKSNSKMTQEIKMQSQIGRRMAIKLRKKMSEPDVLLLPLAWQQWVVVDLECMEQEPCL
jgi:hypothetical protein